MIVFKYTKNVYNMSQFIELNISTPQINIYIFFQILIILIYIFKGMSQFSV